MLYKTKAIVIKKQNLNDLDRLLTVYSKDFGKLSVKAKSVRKNQAKLKGHLELFLLSHLMIAPGKGFDIVTGAETIESFSGLRKNLSSLFAAYYISEITDKLIAGPEKDENVWKLLSESLKSLDQGKDVKGVTDGFENKLLQFLGYGEQKNPVSFIESMANERIKSYSLLTKTF